MKRRSWNGKALNIWQTQPSWTKVELLLKQIIFSWIQWRTMSPVAPQNMGTSFFLQSLTAADAPHKLTESMPINSPTVSNGTIFTPPPSRTTFSGDKETIEGKKNAWPNSVFRTAAPRYEEPVCLYIRIKYFLHYTTNPINSFRKRWNVIIQGVPFIKGLRLFPYRGCIFPTGNKKAERRTFSQGRMGPNPHHAEVDHPLTIHMSVKQAPQEKNQPFLPL